MVEDGKLSFGPFEFYPHRRYLTRHGYRVKLQPKAAALLARLLERPGEVVSRAELQKALWPDGTHVDFEVGIKVAMKKLRDALSDSSENPTFIETVHGEGYRFIAPITGQVPTAPALPNAPDFLPPTHLASASMRQNLIRLGAAIAVVAFAFAIVANLPRVAPLRFQNRDWVLIAAFDNRTGEAVLDGSMEYALERELSQSRYLNVAPHDRIADDLTLLRQSPQAVLSEDLARQIAVRDGGIKGVLAGRIEKYGPQYVFTVRLLDPAGGPPAGVFERHGSQSELIGAARSIAGDIRNTLGDPAVSGAAPAAPERVTTPSLAAFRAFSAGMKLANEGNGGPRSKWAAAAELFEEALRDDPQFASAHIYAAHCYSNAHNAEGDALAAPHYQAAFRLAPGVTERERLFILAGYYTHYLHDDRRALAAYQALVSLYPDDYWGLNNLALAAQRLGMHEEEMQARERRVDLRPNPDLITVDALWWYYRREQADPRKAKKYADLLRRLISNPGTAPDAKYGYLEELDTATVADSWWRGDIQGAGRELDRITGIYLASPPVAAATGMFLMGPNLTLGKIAAARRVCARLEPAVRSECLLRAAAVEGDPASIKALVAEVRTYGPTPSGLLGDEAVALWFGETEAAREWLAIGRPNPGVAIGGGHLLLADGHPAEAAATLSRLIQPIRPAGAGSWPHLWSRMALAAALERQGKFREGIAQLERDTRPRNIYLNNGYLWPLCRMELAEIYRKAGRPDDAARVEKEMRFYLSEGDPHQPLLARLQSARAAR